MNSLDTIAGLALGSFLIAVTVRGKTDDLVTLAKRDRQFLQWAIALGILVYLYNVPELRGVMGFIIALAFIGLGLIAGTQISEGAKSFWNFLGGE